MAPWTPTYLQMEGNCSMILMLEPKILRGVSTKTGRSVRLKPVRRKSGMGMRMDRVPRDDGDHEKSSLAFGEHEAIYYSAVQGKEDWRTFRALQVNSNSAVPVISDNHRPRNFHGAEWAHEINNVEEGCVLVATHKLDSHPLLSESVVLLLRCSSFSSSSTSEYKGIVLNKKFPAYCNHMDLADPMLRDLCVPTFAGGPALGASGFGSKFHLLTTQGGLAGFECILPGLYVGNNGVSLQSAMTRGVGMRFYLGELELNYKHLRAQVEAFGWWKVVACSTDAIFSSVSSPTHMWHHINHLLTG